MSPGEQPTSMYRSVEHHEAHAVTKESSGADEVYQPVEYHVAHGVIRNGRVYPCWLGC